MEVLEAVQLLLANASAALQDPQLLKLATPEFAQLGQIATAIIEGMPVPANDEIYSRWIPRIARFSFQTRSMTDFASRPDPAC